MATASISSASVGTAVVAAAGSLKGLAITMPIAANADSKTPLTLLDAGASGAGPVLFSASVADLSAAAYAVKPNSVPVTPGGPTAPPAGTIMAGGNQPFAQGLYVKSCPANVTFTATT